MTIKTANRDSTDFIVTFTRAMDDAAPWLASLPESTVAWRPKPGAWSAKEIIGHLIDSAANNHQRFGAASGRNHFSSRGHAQAGGAPRQHHQGDQGKEIPPLCQSNNPLRGRGTPPPPPAPRYRNPPRHN